MVLKFCNWVFVRTESVCTIALFWGGGKSYGVDVPLNAANCGKGYLTFKKNTLVCHLKEEKEAHSRTFSGIAHFLR